ncbi:SET domain containing protein [Trichuris trichiura]|uniref:SET domain containing protein n=1 Tax=Trichuris trichiura TaxID=36087 RepID=A0A077Z930_TRITR|nr:SET domain containing protein [Trichuris trichiura]
MDGKLGESLSFTQITENVYVSDKYAIPVLFLHVLHYSVETNAPGAISVKIVASKEYAQHVNVKEWVYVSLNLQKEYKKLDVFAAGKKGLGIRAAERIQDLSFIIEYVGEVLSGDALLERVHRYDVNGVKHRYMMSLDNGDVIDATVKGNLSRLINHSCDPNCIVRKWMVLGRTRAGIFALKDIEVGEELSFDYQFDVHEMSMQVCYCGAANCRGVLASVRSLNKSQERPVVAQLPAFRRLNAKDEQLLLTLIKKGSLKTFSDAVQCTGLMRHTEDLNQRLQLAELIMNSRDQVRRDFLSPSSCIILRHWMTDVIDCYDKVDEYVLKMLDLLNCLPFPHKTMLEKSCLLEELGKWTNVDFLKQLLSQKKTEEHNDSAQEGDDPLTNVDVIAKKAEEMHNSWMLLKNEYKIPRLRIEKEKPSSCSEQAERRRSEQHSSNRIVDNSISDFSVLKRPSVSSPGCSLSPPLRWSPSHDVRAREFAQDDSSRSSEDMSRSMKKHLGKRSVDINANISDREEVPPKKTPAALNYNNVTQLNGSRCEKLELLAANQGNFVLHQENQNVWPYYAWYPNMCQMPNVELEIQDKSSVPSPVQQLYTYIPVLPIFEAPKGPPVYSPTDSSSYFSNSPQPDQWDEERFCDPTSLRADFKKEMASMVVSMVEKYATSTNVPRLSKTQFKRFARCLTKMIGEKYLSIVLSSGNKKSVQSLRSAKAL